MRPRARHTRPFLFGLGDIELGSRQEARGDEFEAEFLVVFGLRGHKTLNNLDIKICKPNHYCHIHEIERGVEYRQAKRYAHLHHGYLVQHIVAGGKRVVEQVVVELGIGFLEGVDKVEQVVGIALADYLGEPGVELGKGHKHGQAPDCAKQVEEQVAHGRAFRGHISAHRGKDGGDGCADIGAEHHGAGQVVGNPAFRAHDEDNGECRGRRLYNHREHDAHKQEDTYRAEAHRSKLPQISKHLGIGLQIRHISADHIQAHK